MKKFFAVMMAVLMTLTMLAGCGGGADSEGETVKIGLITPLTGDVAVYGNAVKNAVELYVKEFNEKGGFSDGSKIQLITYDDKGDATEAVNAYNKLVTADEVVAIVGAVTSTPTLAVAEASAADNIPVITGTATHEDVTTFGNNMFRSCFLDPYQGTTMANVAKALGAKSAAVLYNTEDSYSSGLMQSFSDACVANGIKIVATEGYAKADVDFKAQLTNIKGANPDVIFIPDYYNKVYPIAQQANEVGLSATMLGVDGVDGIFEIEGMNSEYIEGFYFSNHYFEGDESQLVQDFLTNYEAEYGAKPNALAALGYDAMAIMVNAIQKAIDAGAKVEPTAEFYQAVIDQLDATDIDCVTGHITYDENNNPQKTCSVIKIEGGKYTLFGKY